MTEKFSITRESNVFINDLLEINEIQENSSGLHLKLKDIVQSFEFGTVFGSHEKIQLSDNPTCDYLTDIQSIVELLIQNDAKSKIKCEKLLYKNRKLHDFLQFPSTIKESLEKMKLTIATFKRSMNNSIKKLGSNLQFIEKNSKIKYLKSIIEDNEKLRKVLAKVIPDELFINGSVKLKDEFFQKYDLKSSENLTFFARLKKYKEHTNLLSNILKVLIKGLVELFNENSSKVLNKSPQKFIFRSNYNSPEPIVASLEKKNIMRKISKLVIRGSLTEEEAGRVISNFNEFENSPVAHEDQPLTETRVKACENKSNLYSDADKLLKLQKKDSKSNEKLRRRKSNKPILRYLSSSFISPGQNSTKNKASSFLYS